MDQSGSRYLGAVNTQRRGGRQIHTIRRDPPRLRPNSTIPHRARQRTSFGVILPAAVSIASTAIGVAGHNFRRSPRLLPVSVTYIQIFTRRVERPSMDMNLGTVAEDRRHGGRREAITSYERENLPVGPCLRRSCCTALLINVGKMHTAFQGCAFVSVSSTSHGVAVGRRGENGMRGENGAGKEEGG